ncbi:Os02g0526650 [Oryza sativa Japonica Group]|uniref:Os02g0526650 protein n=1 Tax=Oryza sativa subsp. japonica TaxID=39947 RepID=A0A0P0VJS6_ORYSJ|nr:Os02g0526650 [Oryza sativa Japonica Group]
MSTGDHHFDGRKLQLSSCDQAHRRGAKSYQGPSKHDSAPRWKQRPGRLKQPDTIPQRHAETTDSSPKILITVAF